VNVIIFQSGLALIFYVAWSKWCLSRYNFWEFFILSIIARRFWKSL